jgi:hypothetical protein
MEVPQGVSLRSFVHRTHAAKSACIQKVLLSAFSTQGVLLSLRLPADTGIATLSSSLFGILMQRSPFQRATAEPFRRGGQLVLSPKY